MNIRRAMNEQKIGLCQLLIQRNSWFWLLATALWCPNNGQSVKLKRSIQCDGLFRILDCSHIILSSNFSHMLYKAWMGKFTRHTKLKPDISQSVYIIYGPQFYFCKKWQSSSEYPIKITNFPLLSIFEIIQGLTLKAPHSGHFYSELLYLSFPCQWEKSQRS